MALKLEAQLTQDAEKRQKLERSQKVYEKKYDEYIEKFGVKDSVHIPRESGDEISLLTELVYTNQVIDLFPKKTKLDSPAIFDRPVPITKRGLVKNTYSKKKRYSKIESAHESSSLDSDSQSRS